MADADDHCAVTIAEIRAADFQAAWYFTLILVFIAVAVGTGAFYAGRAVRQMWRAGDRGVALWAGTATAVGVLFLVSMVVTTLVGFVLQSRGST